MKAKLKVINAFAPVAAFVMCTVTGIAMIAVGTMVTGTMAGLFLAQF
jgi:hypothetical protein